jgi:cytochrome c-type biogenesis protein CcsB
LVPRGDGDPKQPWHGIAEVMFADGKEPVPGAMLLLAEKAEPPSDIPEPSRAAVADAWKALVNSWLKADAAGVDAAAAALAAELPKIDPAGYPQRDRLAWEHWYFSNGHMTKTWLVYMAASILLLLGFVYRWPRARTAGFAVFAIAVALHTLAVMLRWYIAGRWPNSNMFEAVTTAAWFGAIGAIAIEWFVRRSAMYSMFALGAAVSAMVALMAAYFLPVQLNPSINNMMPVLHDVWLYIHTNVIIFSYVLIFMAAVSGALYAAHRAFGGAASFARVGGAGSLIVAGPDGEARMTGTRAGLGEVLDGVTMVLMELSFVLLWAGIVMGAIWADHSWGRPWGWDPKEVFALNTFIVFAVLVHVRLKVKDKGMWTAVLAVIGAAVMLFNWIVINFVITGLHSYA